MNDDCIRCEVAPSCDDNGYCGHCNWAVIVEIQEGFYQLLDYLLPRLAYTDWRLANGVPA